MCMSLCGGKRSRGEVSGGNKRKKEKKKRKVGVVVRSMNWV